MGLDEALVWSGCCQPLVLVTLHPAANAAVTAGHEHQIARGNFRVPVAAPESTRTAPANAPGRPSARPTAPRPEAWSIRMEGFGGPAQPSPTTGQCLNGGLGWLEVQCNRCKTRASLPLDAIRRPRDTPVWKLEAALKCRSCRKGRYAPPVHMIKLMINLTETREITPCLWGHPDEER
jgi:hypothetical protein